MVKNLRKFICVALAAAMVLSVVGCSAPKLTLGGTPKTAATIDGTDYSTGEYLAYLYNNFYNMYYSQGLYQYAAYGYDVWTQTFPYGEGDDAKEIPFDEYLKKTAQDSMVRQVALEKMLGEHKLSWDEDEAAEIDENMKDMEKDAYISLGFSNENFINTYKKLSLNEHSLFYGLYGEGGERAVSEADRKTYFDDNYLSYKIISVSLTDSKGNEMDDAAKKEVTDQLDGYLKEYNASKNFEAIVDKYNASKAAEGAETTASTDEQNRVNVDTKNGTDAELVTAIRGVDVGTAKVVTYKANGTTATAALILRLDIHEPASLFTDETENIIAGLKYEEFDKEVDELVATIKYSFNKKAVKACDPKKFVEG